MTYIYFVLQLMATGLRGLTGRVVMSLAVMENRPAQERAVIQSPLRVSLAQAKIPNRKCASWSRVQVPDSRMKRFYRKQPHVKLATRTNAWNEITNEINACVLSPNHNAFEKFSFCVP